MSFEFWVHAIHLHCSHDTSWIRPECMVCADLYEHQCMILLALHVVHEEFFFQAEDSSTGEKERKKD